jgi:hypothetical protein
VKKPFTGLAALVRPDFNHDRVAIALRNANAAKIHVELKITIVMADGSVRKVFGASHDGVTNALGVFTYNLKIGYPERKAGKATLTITTTSASGNTRTLTRSYRYEVYG